MFAKNPTVISCVLSVGAASRAVTIVTFRAKILEVIKKLPIFAARND